MKQILQKYYLGSGIVTLVCMVLSAITANIFSLSMVPTLMTTLILGVLEISLSVDNAVLNAKILETMDEVWRKRFITWGMPIAVFGMRFAFPLVIVAVITGLSPFGVLGMAISEPEKFSTLLMSAHTSIMAFGGSFLMMVFLKFFVDENKVHHWIVPIENKMCLAGRIESIHIVLTLCFAFIISKLSDHAGDTFFYSSLTGVMLFVVIDAIKAWVGIEDTKGMVDTTAMVGKAGFAGFMYLEVLDASFSLDGVLGATALTQNIFIIMLGLTIGAMFVRSMTIHMLELGTVTKFKYLEHSAYWAIGILSVIMLISPVFEVPETVTGLLGAIVIAIGVFHSHKDKGVSK